MSTMIRAISPFANYSIQLIEGKEQVGMDSRGVIHSVTLQDPVLADFHTGGLTEWEEDAALLRFNFSGLPEGVHPLTRVSVFDPEAYVLAKDDLTPEQQKELYDKIVGVLKKKAEVFPGEFILVEKPGAPKPWPSYDKDSVEEILQIQERLEIDPELVRIYEEENSARDEIVTTMRARKNGVSVEEITAAEGALV